MEQKAKFIIIGLIVFSVVFIFLFAQAVNQQQILLRESNDLKNENGTLLSKISRLEDVLKEGKGKLDALQKEKSILDADINTLRNENKDLVARLEDNRKLLEEISRDAARMKNEKAKMDASKVSNNTLIRQLKSLTSRKAVLEQRVKSLQEEKTSLEKRLNEISAAEGQKAAQASFPKNETAADKSVKPESGLEKRRESVELPAIIVRSSADMGKPEAKVSEGKILAVNTDSNFVIIDLGVAAGVKVGDTFNVYRGQKSIASIIVIQVRDNISACDIKKASSALKIGDNIK